MGTTAPICLHTLKIGNRASGVDTHRKEHDRPLPRLVRRGAYHFALLYRIALRALLLRAPFKNGEPCFDLAMSVPVEEGATLAVSSVGETWLRFVQCGLFERRSHPYGQGRSMDQDSRLPTLRDRDNGLLVYLGMF